MSRGLASSLAAVVSVLAEASAAGWGVALTSVSVAGWETAVAAVALGKD